MIQPGDVLHCDVGITVARLNTDTQHNAYVLLPGETDAPAGLKTGARQRQRDAGHRRWRKRGPGRTGNEILASVLQRMKGEGHRRHDVLAPDRHARPRRRPARSGCGTTRTACPAAATRKVIPSMWFSIELQATTPVPEWGGQPVRMAQEEDVIVGADGKALLGAQAAGQTVPGGQPAIDGWPVRRQEPTARSCLAGLTHIRRAAPDLLDTVSTIEATSAQLQKDAQRPHSAALAPAFFAKRGTRRT